MWSDPTLNALIRAGRVLCEPQFLNVQFSSSDTVRVTFLESAQRSKKKRFSLNILAVFMPIKNGGCRKALSSFADERRLSFSARVLWIHLRSTDLTHWRTPTVRVRLWHEPLVVPSCSSWAGLGNNLQSVKSSSLTQDARDLTLEKTRALPSNGTWIGRIVIFHQGNNC